MDTITRTKCPDSEKLDFLPTHVGKEFLQYENLVYTLMAKACENYSGGFWDYYSILNGGFYMLFDSDKPLRLQWSVNYFDGELSSDAASIGINFMAQNALSWETRSESSTDAFYAFREYA